MTKRLSKVTVKMHGATKDANTKGERQVDLEDLEEMLQHSEDESKKCGPKKYY